MAGHRYDQTFLDRLPPDADPCAERGEFHTCVAAGPMFKQRLPLVKGKTVTREGFVFTDFRLASPLADK